MEVPPKDKRDTGFAAWGWAKWLNKGSSKHYKSRKERAKAKRGQK